MRDPFSRDSFHSWSMGEVYEVGAGFLQGVHVELKVILPQITGDAGGCRPTSDRNSYSHGE